MSQPSFGGFKWGYVNIDVTIIPEDSPNGFALEVDLEYPQHLHTQGFEILC